MAVFWGLKRPWKRWVIKLYIKADLEVVEKQPPYQSGRNAETRKNLMKRQRRQGSRGILRWLMFLAGVEERGSKYLDSECLGAKTRDSIRNAGLARRPKRSLTLHRGGKGTVLRMPGLSSPEDPPSMTKWGQEEGDLTRFIHLPLPHFSWEFHCAG